MDARLITDWLGSAVRGVRHTTRRLTGNRSGGKGVSLHDAEPVGWPMRQFHPAGARAGVRMHYFCGGGFISGSIDSNHGLCNRLAAQSGLDMVSASYCLAPEHPAPAQLEDALALTAALAGQSGHLLIGGDSAGARLALHSALDVHARQPGRIAGALLLYSFVDLAAQPETLLGYARPAVAVMRAALGEAYPWLMALDLGQAPPCALLLGAALDPVAPGALALANALADAGVATPVRRHPLLVHGGLNLANRVTLIDRLLAVTTVDLMQIMPDG